MKRGAKPEGRPYSIVGIVCAILSLAVLPIVFGPLAIIFGIIAMRKGDKKLGKITIVLGIIFAILGALFGLYVTGLFSSNNNIGADTKIDQDKQVQSFLEDEGYEVLSVLYSNYDVTSAIKVNLTKDTNCYPYRGSYDSPEWANSTCWSNYSLANLEMKSLGNREKQLWDGLIAMGDYKDVSIYHIIILEPTRQCSYYLKGSTYRLWSDNVPKTFNENATKEEINILLAENSRLSALVTTQIMKTEVCN